MKEEVKKPTIEDYRSFTFGQIEVLKERLISMSHTLQNTEDTYLIIKISNVLSKMNKL